MPPLLPLGWRGVKMFGVARTGLWGGRTAEQRRSERRTRMIDAAIATWNEQGWASVTMRAICAKASLNDRYFTDEFGDRDGLLVATWESIKDHALGELAHAYAQGGQDTSWEDLTRRVVTVFVNWMTAQPAYAHILLSRNEGSPALEIHRRNAFHRAIDLVLSAAEPRLEAGFDEQALKLDVVASVGGFIEVLRSWQSGYIAVDADHIIEHTSRSNARLGKRETGRR